MPLPAPPPDGNDLVALRVAFGERLRAARRSKGLTQEQVGERAGIDRAAYSELERGQRDARLSTLLRIERAIGGRLDLVVKENEPPS